MTDCGHFDNLYFNPPGILFFHLESEGNDYKRLKNRILLIDSEILVYIQLCYIGTVAFSLDMNTSFLDYCYLICWL